MVKSSDVISEVHTVSVTSRVIEAIPVAKRADEVMPAQKITGKNKKVDIKTVKERLEKNPDASISDTSSSSAKSFKKDAVKITYQSTKGSSHNEVLPETGISDTILPSSIMLVVGCALVVSALKTKLVHF